MDEALECTCKVGRTYDAALCTAVLNVFVRVLANRRERPLGSHFSRIGVGGFPGRAVFLKASFALPRHTNASTNSA